MSEQDKEQHGGNNEETFFCSAVQQSKKSEGRGSRNKQTFCSLIRASKKVKAD
jgi:hypothetical protein